MSDNSKRKVNFLINCAFFAILVVIIYFAVKYVLGWVMPFIIGFILAAVVQRPARYLHEKKHANMKACSVVGVLLLTALLIVIMGFCLFKLFRWTSDGAQSLPAIIDSLTSLLKSISENISPLMTRLQKSTGMKFDTSLSGISQQLLRLSQLLDWAAGVLHDFVSSLPIFIFDLIITIVAGCFIAADYQRVKQTLFRSLPERYRETARELKNFFLNTVTKLVKAYLKLMVITFVELSIGLMLLGIPNAIVISAVIALVDIMPVLGTGTVMIPWAIIEFLAGKFYLGAGLAIVYAIISVVRNIIEPRLVGNHIGLHPLVTLLAMVIGLKALGFAGMIFFPIGILILKHLYDSGIIRLWR